MKKEKMIVLRDYNEPHVLLYVSTNAPKEEIENAIIHRNNELEKGNYGSSDFEIIQDYLNDKGYYFFDVNLEEYYW